MKKKINETLKKTLSNPDIRLKMSIAQKGKKLSDKTKNKIRKSLMGNKYSLGNHLSDETKKKISLAKKGFKHTEGVKQRIREKHLGSLNGMYGKHCSNETKLKMSLSHRGSKGGGWKGGISSVRELIRKSYKYTQWRQNVYIKDDFTCQSCKVRSGVDKKVYLHAHHKYPYHKLLDEAQEYMPLFDVYSAAMLYTPLWDVNNGETLCYKCHGKINRRR